MQKEEKPEEPEQEEGETEFDDIEALLKTPNPLVPAWTVDDDDFDVQREIEKIPHDEPQGVHFRTKEEKETPTVGKTFSDISRVQPEARKTHYMRTPLDMYKGSNAKKLIHRS